MTYKRLVWPFEGLRTGGTTRFCTESRLMAASCWTLRRFYLSTTNNSEKDS